MTRVLALVDHSHLDSAVLATAGAVAANLHADVDAVHVDPTGVGPESDAATARRTDSDIEVRHVVGPVVDTLTSEVAGEGVVAVVMGSRDLHASHRPLGHVAESLIVAARVPVVIVPPSGRTLPKHDPSGSRPRLLVPLDGEEPTSRALASSRPIAAWGDVTVLHVFDASSAPMLTTSEVDRAILAEEFAARHAGDMASTVELRLGQATAEIADAAHRLDMDAVVLCWHQRLSSDRADVVRKLVTDGRIPLILVPV